MCYSHNPMASSGMGAMGPGVCVLACVPFHLNCKRNIRTGSASELRYYDCSSHYELEEFAGLTPKFSHMLQRGRLMYKVNRSDSVLVEITSYTTHYLNFCHTIVQQSFHLKILSPFQITNSLVYFSLKITKNISVTANNSTGLLVFKIFLIHFCFQFFCF